MATLDFFQNDAVQHNDFFDDGPASPKTKMTNVARIDKEKFIRAHWTLNDTLKDSSKNKSDLEVNSSVSLSGLYPYANGMFGKGYRGFSHEGTYGSSAEYQIHPNSLETSGSFALGKEFTLQVWFKIFNERLITSVEVIDPSVRYFTLAECTTWDEFFIYHDGWNADIRLKQPGGAGTEQFIAPGFTFFKNSTSTYISYGGGDVQFSLTGSSFTLENKWHHYVARRRGTNITLFLDGRKSQEIFYSEGPFENDTIFAANSGETLKIGSTSIPNVGIASNSFPFLWSADPTVLSSGQVIDNDAMVDEVAIWNAALTDEEILFLWNNGGGNAVADLRAVRTNIDTTSIDAYRQGVEITQVKHFDAGMAKISAGEAGHYLRQNCFGMNRNKISQSPWYGDLDRFDPAIFISSQKDHSYTVGDVLSLPVVVATDDRIEGNTYDGIIEPLTIRAIAGFYTIDSPRDAHDIQCDMMAGSSNFGSCQITQVDYFDVTSKTIGFLDQVSKYETNLNTNIAKVKPYDDSRTAPQIDHYYTGTWESDMAAAVLPMTGSTDNYISSKQRSSPAGWDYDFNTGIGTDSITFGGMTY